MTVTIRVARARDANALVDLAESVGAEPEAWLIADGDWRSVAQERRYLRLAARSRHVGVFVAESEGRIVGRLTIARDGHPASRHVADVGLMVARAARGRGVGTALLASADDWSRASGIAKIELHVFPHNLPAIALYESLGYRREGYRTRHFRRGDELVDAILMAKWL